MSPTSFPEVLWAQRSHKTEVAKNVVYLTISVPDVTPSSLKLDLTSRTLTFFGHSESLNRDYSAEIEFYDEIEVSECKTRHLPMNISLVLQKKEPREEYWPRLTKDSKKIHGIKTDFSKWVDEDEQEGAPDDNLANMGGLGGMPGMGDMSSMMGDAGGDFSGLDMSSLGGEMGDDDDDDDDDDNEMPSLEGEDKKEESGESKTPAPAESSDKAKIQEVS